MGLIIAAIPGKKLLGHSNPRLGYGLAMPLTVEKSSNYFSKNTRQDPETRMSPRRLGIRVSNQGF